MDVQSILPYVGTNKVETILEIVYNIHKQSLENKSLKGASKVNLTFNSGCTVKGYIIGLDLSCNHLTLISGLEHDQSGYIQYLDLNGIQAVGIDFSEKIIESFCTNRAPEGLGEPPTILALKRRLQEVEKNLQNTFHKTLKLHIDWQEKNSDRTLWAIDGILKQLLKFNRNVENDTDLIETFNLAVKEITIINSKTSKMSIHEGVFTIAFMFSGGLLHVEDADTIKNFLYKIL